MPRFEPKPHVKRGDEVLVMAGKDRGKTGTINSMEVKEKRIRAVVGGVNMIKRHTKGRPGVRQAGIIEREAPIQLSNLMLICPNCGKPTRVGRTTTAAGVHVRVCKKCDQVVDRS